MVKLAIRDDDMNYFTKVEDIEHIYKDFEGFPITYAVIPEVLDVSTKGACSDTKGNTTPRFIGDNKELVEWVKAKLAKGECDVLMHGINHNYKYIDGVRRAEMQWRDKEPNLKQTILHWKKNLSELFDYDITCFVAPSNRISKYCLSIVEDCGLNFSGIVPMKYNERSTLRNICNYIHRWVFRAITRLPYPGVYKYSGHKEINACLLQSYEYLVKMYEYCHKHNLPMVINVHYWALRDKPKDYDALFHFIKYAKSQGAIPAKLTDIMNEK